MTHLILPAILWGGSCYYPSLIDVAETVLPRLLKLVSRGACTPATEIGLLTTLLSCLNFTNPSLGNSTTCMHEPLTLYSCILSDLTPLTNSYLLASPCHPCLPSLTRLLKWEHGSQWLMAWILIIPYFSWFTVNICFLLHKNNEVSYRRWMSSVYIYIYMILCLSESFEHPGLISLAYSRKGEALQGGLFDFSEDILEVCKPDEFAGPSCPPSLPHHWRARNVV